MPEYGTDTFTFADPAVRHIEERDIPALIELFRLNYGDDYAIPEFYDERWVKRGIYSDHIIWLVIEEEGEIVASGAVILDYGDYNDQIGEIGRLVVHPERKGRGLGKRIIHALLDATDDTVEFAFGEARTTHPISQILFERGEFGAVGFMPQGYQFGEWRESFVIYVNLYGNARRLRRKAPPRLIPEIAPLARHALASLGLPTTLEVAGDVTPYPADSLCSVEPLTRRSLARLVRIEHGRLVEPLLFGGLSLEQGMSLIRRREALYLTALDEAAQPVGAIGYQLDRPSKLVKGIEMVAEDDALRGHLCGALLEAAEAWGAAVIEVNLSAYDPRLQRTFAEQGFQPVAYAPAMVFHGVERLDVVKMMKLAVPYDPGDLALTDAAREVTGIVAASFA